MNLLEQWLCKADEDLGSAKYLLNGLDVAFRYPNVQLEPTKIDVENAIASASEILDFVKSKCV